VLVAGAFGERRPAIWARRVIGAGLLARAGLGGVAAAKLIGLPEPGETFRRLDARYYRTICAVLGSLTVDAARRPINSARKP
jgi:hypothetical protein